MGEPDQALRKLRDSDRKTDRKTTDRETDRVGHAETSDGQKDVDHFSYP